MTRSLSFARAPLAALALIGLALGLATSSMAAVRHRLRCSVSPRSLSTGGGEIRIFADAGEEPLEVVVATIMRPDGTPTTVALGRMEVGDGFEGFYDVPANTGRGVQKYTVKVSAEGEHINGATVNCGAVKVKGQADVPPLVISDCGARPRQLPSAGGAVTVEARVVGKKRGLEVRATISTAGGSLETELKVKGAVHRGTLTLPANMTAEPQVFALKVVAESAELSPVQVDCGLVTVAPATASGGIGVVGTIRGLPVVQTYNPDTLALLDTFFGFDSQIEGTATLAVGDVTGDGKVDFILGAGPGAAPLVQVIRGGDLEDLGTFLAYSPSFTGGVNVAAGDVNGDGRADIITAAGAGGGPHVKVFDGFAGAELASFFAYEPSFQGGVRVAVGDVNGDGQADIVTGAGPGAGPHVKVFNGLTGTPLRSFLAYPAAFAGGVSVAVGDVNGDGRADVITGAGEGAAGGHVKVFDGRNGAELRSFPAFGTSFMGGVVVAAGDVDGDGKSDLIVGSGPGAAGGHVKVFNGVTGNELRSFIPFDTSFVGGVSVAAWR